MNLRFAVNWPNPRGIPQTGCVMMGKKKADKNIIILQIHPCYMEMRVGTLIVRVQLHPKEHLTGQVP